MDIQVSTHYYGSHDSQRGDLFLPVDGIRKGIICLIHGGYWMHPYDLSQMNNLAVNLVRMGFGVWNMEYRRIGETGGGWPGTFDDVLAGVNYLGELKSVHESDITLVGHSAGGHLALWLTHQKNRLNLTINQVIALAPVTDLMLAYQCNMGDGVVRRLLHATPEDNIERYHVTSPVEMLPLTETPQVVIHGSEDEYIDIGITRDYVHKARSLANDVRYIEIKGGYHLDFLDPSSASANAFFQTLVK